jgi:hypothetical protein
MHTQGNLQVAETTIGWAVGGSLFKAKRLRAWIREALDAWADARAAAVLYEQLYRLCRARAPRHTSW